MAINITMDVIATTYLPECGDDCNATNETVYECDSPILDSPISSLYFQSTVYVMYSIIFAVAICGNGIVCYIVVSLPRMRTVTNYFIMNLAVGDILITIFCVPFTSVSYLLQYWSFGAILCPVVNYSQAVSVFVSAYTLVAISVDRYMAIMWPLRPRVSQKLAAYIIFFVWLIASITALPIPIVSKLGQPDIWYEKCERFLCHEDWSGIGYEYANMYTVALMVLQYIIPLSVLLFTYTSIAIVIWCHRVPGEAENSRDQRIAKSKRKMVKMMVTVVFVFSLCWLPFNVFWVIQEQISDDMRPYLWFVLHWLAMSHACYNPIIYCYMNSRFRSGFLQALSTIPCCNRCLPSLLMHPRSRSSGGFPLTSVEGTESSLLHRNNTCTTYISMRRKNGSRSSSYSNQAPVRSVSMLRNSNNHHHQTVRRIRYPTQILEDQI